MCIYKLTYLSVVTVRQCITTIDGRQSSVSFASRESGVGSITPGSGLKVDA